MEKSKTVTKRAIFIGPPTDILSDVLVYDFRTVFKFFETIFLPQNETFMAIIKADVKAVVRATDELACCLQKPASAALLAECLN